MSRTYNFRKSVRTKLLTVMTKVTYGAATGNDFPCAVFRYEDVSAMDGVILGELEINVLGYGRDTETIENNCDSIINLLDHVYCEETTIAYTSYFERKNNVESDDPNIIRRRLVFSVKLYDKE